MSILLLAILISAATAIPSEPESAECFGVNSGVDYSPGSLDIFATKGLGIAGCCALCKRTLACLTFVWSISTETCWLKSANSPRTINPDRVSGFSKQQNMDASEHCVGIDSGLDISPMSHDISDIPNTDLAGCCAYCNSVPTCLGYVWSKSSKTCWLKSTSSGFVKSDDRISGLRRIEKFPITPTTQKSFLDSTILCEFRGKYITEAIFCKACGALVSHDQCCLECAQTSDDNFD